MKIAHFHVWDRKNKGDLGIVISIQDLLKEKLPKCKINDFSVEKLRDGISDEDLKKINQNDLVLIGGGGIYYRWFLPFDIKSIKKIKVPIIIFGVGYINEIGAKPLNKKSIESIIKLNEISTLSSVRDINTLKFLKKKGLKKNIHLIGDPAVFLNEKKIKTIKKDGKIKLGININYSGWLGFGKYESKIMNSYISVIKSFQKKYNAEIYYLLHHPDELKIVKKIPIKNIKIIDLKPYEQKYVYRKMDMIIGMMLHSVVMSFGAETPFVNIGYDIRNKGFAEFIGFPELNINANDLKDIQNFQKTVENIFQKRTLYIKNFKIRKKEIWKEHKDFLKKIKNLSKKT